MWEHDWTKKNLGYPNPEEFDAMTHKEFEALYSNLLPTSYEYARIDEEHRHHRTISDLEQLDPEGNPTVKVNKELEFGWLKWGQKSGMGREKYVEFYNRYSNWSNDCESPIECELYDKVIKLGLKPDVNSTLGDLLFECKRDIAGRWLDDNAADRYDQIYFIKDKGRKVPLLIVECDGKEAHTRIEDIEKDAKKEYNLSIHFPHVLFLRFSGSEIHKSSDNCASVIKKTFDFVSSIYPLLKANPNMVRHLRNTAVQKLANKV